MYTWRCESLAYLVSIFSETPNSGMFQLFHVTSYINDSQKSAEFLATLRYKSFDNNRVITGSYPTSYYEIMGTSLLTTLSCSSMVMSLVTVNMFIVSTSFKRTS